MHTRRDMLGLAVCAAAAVATARCGGDREPRVPAGAIAVPFGDLPEGAHVLRLRDTEPVDIVRVGDGVIARSMFCTHMGCIAAWSATANGYKCPCHGGAYDAEGKPIAGPPLEALRLLPVRVDGRVAIVLPRPRRTT